jgi:hypothetical protein
MKSRSCASDTRDSAHIGGQDDALGPDVVSDRRLDGMGCVDFEHGVHLPRSQRAKIADAQVGEIGDGLDEGVAGDASSTVPPAGKT